LSRDLWGGEWLCYLFTTQKLVIDRYEEKMVRYWTKKGTNSVEPIRMLGLPQDKCQIIKVSIALREPEITTPVVSTLQ